MLSDGDALYALLPAHIRVEDGKAGGALSELMGIIGGQAGAIEADIRRMYDNYFIETCEDWAVPYLADLLGYDLPPGAGSAVGVPARVMAPRREVANLLAHRRRKGTLWLLEEMARDVAGWPARAVEFYRGVATAQHLDHLNLDRPATADLRDAERAGLAGSPFDRLAHTPDIRRICAATSPGRHGIADVGLFVFRLGTYSVTDTEAYCQESVARHRFTFSILGQDAPLFRRLEPERDPTDIPDERNLPAPIGRRALEFWPTDDAPRAQASPELYGPGLSLVVRAQGWPNESTDGMIPADRVIPADLSDWGYKTPRDHVAVDPVLGRIAFPPRQPPRGRVYLSYRYGFPAEIGGGEYARPPVAAPQVADRLFVHPRDAKELEPPHFVSFNKALAHWRAMEGRRPALILELVRSGVYGGRLDLRLAAGETLIIRAAERTRPVIRIADEEASRTDSVVIRGGAGARVVLDGVMVTGGAVEIAAAGEDEAEPKADERSGDLCEVLFSHCTLVPGFELRADCEPQRPRAPSLVLDGVSTNVRIQSSIVGSISIARSGDREPASLRIADSIVDATAAERDAISGGSGSIAYAVLELARSTVVGVVRCHAIVLAENSIFAGLVSVARRQIGCVRFSQVPTGSRTPRRYRCQPDMAVAAALAALPASATDTEKAAVRTEAVRRVQSVMESMRYGTPTYLRLDPCTPDEVRRGAEGENEMGVYFGLFEPHRLALLQRRLDDYVPAGMEAAAILAT
jgi:hypothetical protein